MCWKCGKNTNPEKELFFCKCGVVQSVAPSLTYFDLLQQQPSFELDSKSLGVVFRDTQKFLHPDMFSTKSKEEQQLAEEQSSLLNKAYRTLLKPLSRAIYMLKLQNVAIDEKDTISDPEFLMDIMSINEQIDEASSASDINSLEETNNVAIDNCIQEITQAFKDNRIKDAKNSTIKLRYFTTISERILDLRRRALG
ncbi:Co-chaperone protein HscB homolog [Elysia marginata]|uniref:Co-chaperone protein HscB homolog n=1 Tax=Elysia marginata TaxID=1093978 RepID=A0AAV4HSG6_9GAST|nr:Co-chaperone protein HscB homolog [Elysia marginata]